MLQQIWFRGLPNKRTHRTYVICSNKWNSKEFWIWRFSNKWFLTDKGGKHDANERDRVLRPSIPMQEHPAAMLQLPLPHLNPEPTLTQEIWHRSCLNLWCDLDQPVKDLDNKSSPELIITWSGGASPPWTQMKVSTACSPLKSATRMSSKNCWRSSSKPDPPDPLPQGDAHQSQVQDLNLDGHKKSFENKLNYYP